MELQEPSLRGILSCGYFGEGMSPGELRKREGSRLEKGSKNWTRIPVFGLARCLGV